MTLGFYYHIAAYKGTDDKVYMPGYLGIFIDNLANEVEELYCFMHQPSDKNLDEEDYALISNNVTLVEMGLKTPAWDRVLFPSKFKQTIQAYGSKCDKMLVRAPSPLAPYFFQYLADKTEVVYLIIGDYVNGIKHMKMPLYKKIPVAAILFFNDFLQTRFARKSKVVVNSGELFEKYKSNCKAIYQIKTTTLSKQDFYFREDTCNSKQVQILYTGRLDLAKGLLESVEAIAKLVKEGLDIVFNLVGWEEKGKEEVKIQLKELASNLGLEPKRLIFHGKKKVGPELFAYYQRADIYLLSSYHEGFPRAIWEAMANGLPVIATKVGSIPYYLAHDENAILIEPKSVNQIEEAVKLVINDGSLRRNLIKNAYHIVEDATLEKQSKMLVQYLNA